MITPNKLIGALVLTSAVGGSAGGIYYFTLDKTIQDKLVREHFEIIENNSIDKIWKTAWNEISNDSELKKIETSITSFATLKEWCISNYRESLNEKEKLEKVKKICIKPPKNIAEKLFRKRKNFTNNWGEKLTSLKSGDNAALIKKLQETTTDLQDLNVADKSNKALEKWCESKKNNELPESGSVAEYEEVVKYCVK